jgi:aerobic-type carbon monoxide dehydrogenase small subunit (CoxS/CutS family)
MDGHICRCGTYPRILAAIQRASRAMAASKRTEALKETEDAHV